jgi:hypothetical protein
LGIGTGSGYFSRVNWVKPLWLEGEPLEGYGIFFEHFKHFQHFLWRTFNVMKRAGYPARWAHVRGSSEWVNLYGASRDKSSNDNCPCHHVVDHDYACPLRAGVRRHTTLRAPLVCPASDDANAYPERRDTTDSQAHASQCALQPACASCRLFSVLDPRKQRASPSSPARNASPDETRLG